VAVIDVRVAAVTLQATRPTFIRISPETVESPDPVTDTVVPVMEALEIAGVRPELKVNPHTAASEQE
jgi:hypothetical protein